MFDRFFQFPTELSVLCKFSRTHLPKLFQSSRIRGFNTKHSLKKFNFNTYKAFECSKVIRTNNFHGVFHFHKIISKGCKKYGSTFYGLTISPKSRLYASHTMSWWKSSHIFPSRSFDTDSSTEQIWYPWHAKFSLLRPWLRKDACGRDLEFR